MQRSQGKIVLLTLMLATAWICEAAPPGATVSGVVRDAQGVVQMGALVQVLANDSSLIGTAFTDLHGRYFIAHLVPGKYDVKASAALFMPATRGNLQLRSGARAVVNLTLNTLFETATWLPAERRKADEPADDWKWTLRSAANRPILRLVEDGDSMVISSSVTESPKPIERARAAVTAGDGGFGSNGLHNVFTLNRVLDDGANVILRVDSGSTGRPYTGGPSTEIATGYERQIGFAGAARTLVTYQSHPEMVGSGHVSGLGAMQVASAQRMRIGDAVDLEAGSTVYVLRTASYTTAARPFVKLTAHPSEAWTVGYRMATSRELQSFGDLDAVQQELPVAVVSRGRLQTERGVHQEFSVGRKAGRGVLQVAYYLDSLDRVVVAGGGALSASDIAEVSQSPVGGILADATTGNFRMLGNGYKAKGLNVTLSEPLSPGLWVALTYSTGAALTAQDASALTLPNVATDLTPEMSQTATLALKGRVGHTGTKVRASYRWQPARLVTAVNPYGAFSDQAYFSCYLRQALRLGNLLPNGLEATVDVTNL
ncbi:MAG: carboxypeptidase-like regulatory domain-containing protein, partial [Edaphobacter sp.]